MTPSTRGASTRVSLTPSRGGVSITMWANRSPSVARACVNRGEDRSSDGLAGTGPGRDHEEPGDPRRSDDLRRPHAAHEQVGQAGCLGDAEDPVEIGMPHVGVDQQHVARPELSQADRAVRRDRGLAVLLLERGHQHGLGRAIRRGVHHARPQVAERLREHRAGRLVSDQREGARGAVARSEGPAARWAGSAERVGTSPRVGTRRMASTSRGSRMLVSRYSKRNASATPPTRPTRHPSNRLSPVRGPERCSGTSARSTTEMFESSERRGDLRLLQPGGQGGVELAVRLHFPPEQVVPRHLAVELPRQPSLLVDELPELGLLLKRGPVLRAGRLDEPLDLRLDLPPHLLDVLGQPLHARILGLEGLAELPVPALRASSPPP